MCEDERVRAKNAYENAYECAQLQERQIVCVHACYVRGLGISLFLSLSLCVSQSLSLSLSLSVFCVCVCARVCVRVCLYLCTHTHSRTIGKAIIRPTTAVSSGATGINLPI